jgi:hypothetical protein
MSVVRRALGAEESSAQLAEQIAALRAEQTAAVAEVARLEAQRLAAETFEQAQDFDRQASAARWRADRAGASLSELAPRLTAAKTREQAAALERHRTRRMTLYRRLREAIDSAAAIQAEAITADQAACAELGEGLIRSHLPPIVYRGLLLPDCVQLWASEMDRTLTAPAPVRRPASSALGTTRSDLQHPVRLGGGVPMAPTAPAPRRAQSVSATAPRAVRLGDGDGPVPKAPSLPDQLGPLPDGHVRVHVIRGGYPDSDGHQSQQGRKLILPLRVAETAARNGALEIVEGGTHV